VGEYVRLWPVSRMSDVPEVEAILNSGSTPASRHAMDAIVYAGTRRVGLPDVAGVWSPARPKVVLLD